MSQFIIATDSASAVQRNAITDHVKSKGWAFWHHFDGFWMVATSDYGVVDYNKTTSEQLYNELMKLPVIGTTISLLVIRLPDKGSPMTHFGYGPKPGWEWAKRYWGPVG